MKREQIGRTGGDEYLSDEEVAPLINCLICKNCLPPGMRINGRMCKLDKCVPERA